MELAFFKEFLMISMPTTVGILVIFVAMLAYVAWLQHKQVSFAKQVGAGTMLGILLGLLVQVLSGFPQVPLEVSFVKESVKWFSLVGGGFIDLIRMLVVPLVFISIIHVILTMNQETNLKKLVSSTIGTSLGMVAVAAVVGLTLGTVFHLGEGQVLLTGTDKMREVQPLVDTFRKLIPYNPVEAMAKANIIAVVVFAVIIGTVARIVRKTKTNELVYFSKWFEELHVLISWVADFVIGFMPYGVVGLLGATLAQKGLHAIMDMGLFVALIYVGVLVMLLVQSALLLSFGINPLIFFRKAKEPLIFAFTSRSSMGALPLTVETLVKKLGVHASTANTVGSFGTTAGMQGCAGIFPALCIVYIANVSGITLDATLYVVSVIVIAIGSVGIAGVPGTATMAASVSLSGTGLGSYFSSISPVLAIDPIIDMGRTMLNVSGTMSNALVVDKMMGTWDKDVFMDKKLRE